LVSGEPRTLGSRVADVQRVGGWDAMFLYSETPNLPAHTIKIAIVDACDGFCFDSVRAAVAALLPELEPMRYCLQAVPLRLHHPVWLSVSDVDPIHHVHRVVVPDPGGRRELDRVIARIAEGALDRRRPLWELYYCEGVAENKVALVMKVHHAVADGVASANLLVRATDPAVIAHSTHRALPSRSTEPPSRARLLRAAGLDHLRQALEFPALLRDTARGIAQTRSGARERGRNPELAAPMSAPATFMNHAVTPGRRFATTTLSLAQAKHTARELGVTLNDLILAMAAGALRNLLLAHGGDADSPLIASVPTTTDPSPERISGNALGVMLVSLPVQSPDPLDRVQLVSASTARAKDDFRRLGPELFSRWQRYLPPLFAPTLFRRFAKREKTNRLYNVSISNVRGPREPRSFAGAEISGFYSVGPLSPGLGLNITVWSYVDQLNVSVLTDDSTLGDVYEMTREMRDAFAELRIAAGLSGELEVVKAAMALADGPG
jgi:diacylglycerol O-acyltransferase / wax synthase